MGDEETVTKTDGQPDMTLLGAFEELGEEKTAVSLVVSVRPSFRPHGTTPASSGRISATVSVEKIQISLKSDSNNR